MEPTSLWEKTKANVQKYIDCVYSLWSRKFYIRSVALALAPLIGGAGAAILAVKMVDVIATFVGRHYVELMLAGLAIWWLATWLGERKQEREKTRRMEREQQQFQILRDYEITKEATYTTQAKMVFSVARELGGLGLVVPMRVSNLYSPCRTLPLDNGAATLCQFLIQKERDHVDTEQIKSTMQTKIDQRLSAGEFPGVKTQHIYNGRVHSGLIIDSVRDSNGYIEVYTTLVNDAYCRHKQNQTLGNDAPPPSVSRNDIDY